MKTNYALNTNPANSALDESETILKVLFANHA